jgi:hypothetical protein
VYLFFVMDCDESECLKLIELYSRYIKVDNRVFTTSKDIQQCVDYENCVEKKTYKFILSTII